MAKSDNLPLEEEMVSILGQCGPALTYALQSKFGCTAVLHGVDAASAGAGQSMKPEMRFSTQLSKGLRVSVWRDDLTTHHGVDAVVNAANEHLSHGAGLAKALSDAGGPDIQRESERYIKTFGKLVTGNAIVAPPGYLPYKKIIHVVGPCLPYKPSKSDVNIATPKLEKAVRNILEEMKKHHLKSVAIPAISSGLFNFPLPLCADVIVKTLKQYHDHNYSGAPLEVRLVNHDDLSVGEMKRACCEILGSTVSHSQPAAARGQPPKASYSKAVSHGNGSTLMKVNNVTLNLTKGYIEKQKTGGIVNTISSNLDLSSGAISKAILGKAGKGIQGEISKFYNYNKYSDVIETSGHNLSCSYVYHTICPHKSQASEKVLGDVISKCLSLAQKKRLSSISFPAIGTGMLGFNKQEVAQIMMDTAVEFSKQNNGTNMEIYYVIYPEDTETYRAFEDKLKSLQGATQYSSSFNSPSAQGEIPVKRSRSVFEPTTGYFDSRDPRESAQPYIELSGAFDETLREARSWYCSVFYPVSKNVFTIRNNFIQHFGQHEFGKLLNFQTKFKVSIEVFFKDGCAGVNIHGAFRDVTAAVLEVEAMCCKVQEDFAKEEERDMDLRTSTSSPRKPVDESSSDYRERQLNFSGLKIVRVEKVENSALKQVFELKKKQLDVSTSQRMYQRLPAQYCHLLNRVGFQREFAPPDELIYGEGIYFSGSVDGARKQWKGLADEAYLYFVEAQVLTGKSTHGSPDLIVPPVIPSGDPITLYDSVKGGVDTFVIFNGHQALPEYLIICKKE
ncbi:protein mono-ADP-ribosyltransferase PARP9 isoform X1 [Salvelinus namaycush]|uniref:Protein mono-ADP-ribosyltransferase PARP9 isoform X1 n=1 Tax=Salvelinus namaycush TaxID=8040 RepID=A0A8U0PUW9_SALNM|nr:protein mono-ADP-ribosyltransferase PARP9 isoform X1 [Salvelinus namaycush]XP_038830797.1 protein mono-ADP-ribosyltransferase PARP9 isoform X1 [Salvelinus namaycush]